MTADDLPPDEPPPVESRTPWIRRSAVLAWIDNSFTTLIGVVGVIVAVKAGDADPTILSATFWLAGGSIVKDALGALKAILTAPPSK